MAIKAWWIMNIWGYWFDESHVQNRANGKKNTALENCNSNNEKNKRHDKANLSFPLKLLQKVNRRRILRVVRSASGSLIFRVTSLVSNYCRMFWWLVLFWIWTKNTLSGWIRKCNITTTRILHLSCFYIYLIKILLRRNSSLNKRKWVSKQDVITQLKDTYHWTIPLNINWALFTKQFIFEERQA